MLHLRLRVPDDTVDAVLAQLCDDETVTNVALVRHAFVDPSGSLVMADVARENASGVVGRLRDLGLQHEGSITINEIDAILSDAADKAEESAPGAPDDGVVWVAVEQQLRADTRLSLTFLTFMALAALLAGIGRLLDQPILIVGAMVVAPEFSPVAALCFAVARPRPSMIWPALRCLGSGYALAIVISTLAWSAAYQLGAFTQTEAATGPLTDFIIQPDAWSFVVACLAGVAGVLSLTTSKSGTLVGVFISVTTIPAVGTIAVCLGSGVWHEVGSAALQLALNITGMLLAGTLTLLLQRWAWQFISTHSDRLRPQRRVHPWRTSH